MNRTTRTIAMVTMIAAAVMLCGCGPADQATTGVGRVAGIIAIGHSGLTGENADPDRQGQEARDQSWATGDSARVDSIYLRMVSQDPVHEGHVANTAVAGGPSEMLATQAEEALVTIPTPALAIIQSIDGDIRCDGTDAGRVADFGANVAAAIEVISTSSPDTKVVVVSQRGRPEMLAKLVPLASADPAAGEESCEFVNPSGEFVPANAQYLTAIIEAYEAEQARVCARFENCTDDGGTNTTFEDTEDDLAGGDGNHLTTAGQARTAALLWPVMAKVLGY